MKLFVTVGSTGFDDLVEAATSISFVSNLSTLGFSSLLIQYGASKDIFLRNTKDLRECDIEIQGYDYKTTIEHDIAMADLVISHSGSGTILQALRLHKKLVVIVNESLLGNHQTELAQAMATKNYVVYGDISNLVDTVFKASKHHLEPFPEPNVALFAAALDKQMGFTLN
ncbi:glycosyl transferase [Absidia repens]|uniref:UDP-N-acetylglucosamine transferase subunit ALG13 n=1 Tax=Absidia repens TaxID=90262 RepID=A0A1X2IFK6_9FUNG|nr:glycosyl transferase [Absidia repens]